MDLTGKDLNRSYQLINCFRFILIKNYKEKSKENNKLLPPIHGLLHAGFSALQAFVARK
jgi:hypothetical protein